MIDVTQADISDYVSGRLDAQHRERLTRAAAQNADVRRAISKAKISAQAVERRLNLKARDPDIQTSEWRRARLFATWQMNVQRMHAGS